MHGNEGAGTLMLQCAPPALVLMSLQIKFENNGIIGTIPPELGSIKRLRRFQAVGCGWLAGCVVQPHHQGLSYSFSHMFQSAADVEGKTLVTAQCLSQQIPVVHEHD